MADVRYSNEHEWIRVEGDVGTVGITNYAQDQLGDVVFDRGRIRVDDRVKGGALLMADQPPAARLLQELGPFVTVTLANPSSDYPDGLVHVRAHAIVKIATDDHDKPLAERTLGWVHVRDGSAFKVRDYAGVAALWQASVAAAS